MTLILALVTQVGTYWQWLNLLHAQLPPGGKEPLLLSLDETSIARALTSARGLVVTAKCPIHRLRRRPQSSQVARKRPRRGAMTHVGIIADRPDVQALLPQIFLTNRHTFSIAAVAAATSGNAVIWRENTGWSTASSMVRVIELLAVRLQPVRAKYQPILLMDCATPHLPPAVLAAATKHNIWVVLVPARVTWLLQPLDVFVFREYKRELQKQHRRLVADSPAGVVTDAAWLQLITKVATDFLRSKSWRHAFVQTGAAGAQDSLTTNLRSFKCPSSRGPTAEHLKALLPRRRNVDLESFFRPVLAASKRSRGIA